MIIEYSNDIYCLFDCIMINYNYSYMKSHISIDIMNKLYILLSENQKFIELAITIIDYICPIKDCPAKKYTNEDYLRGIIEVFEVHTYWCNYEGTIKWKTLNDKYVQWTNKGIFNELHKEMLVRYLKTNKCTKTKYQMIDSTSVSNKQGSELVAHNAHTGNKQYTKVSVISNDSGIPFGIHMIAGNVNDSTTVEDTLKKIPIELDTIKYSNNNRHKQYMLADSGYCSAFNRLLLRKRGYTSLIWYNRRNCKDVIKVRQHRFNRKQLKTYKKRSKIESMFSWLKRFPKLNCRYEKTIESFYGLYLLGACYIITNQT